MDVGRYDELFAVVDVESDTAKQNVLAYHRTIAGKIKERGPIWQPFLDSWKSFATAKKADDGHSYLPTSLLQIDHDFYSHAAVCVEGDKIRLKVIETFEGTLEEFYKQIKERNERVGSYLKRWDDGTITRNELRELNGLNPINEPHFLKSIPKSELDKLRGYLLPRAVILGLSRNTIV
jgi:hypothetical protein